MDLKVRIPKRYKNTLSKRFNPKYAKYSQFYEGWMIDTYCPLCGIHNKDGENCNNCPFMKFRNSEKYGCNNWMKNIYKRKKRYWGFVYIGLLGFKDIDKNKAIKSLQWFRDRAEELIKWI